MNLKWLRTNIGCRVRLQPVASRIDENGEELAPLDDDWIIINVTKSDSCLGNIRTNREVTLGSDHIHHFTTDPGRSTSETRYGLLILTVQIFLEPNKFSIQSNLRPGQSVSWRGSSPAEQFLRKRLLDERLKMVIEDYRRRGTPQPMIDAFLDLSDSEKATLYDRAIMWKKSRHSVRNPYRR